MYNNWGKQKNKSMEEKITEKKEHGEPAIEKEK